MRPVDLSTTTTNATPRVGGNRQRQKPPKILTFDLPVQPDDTTGNNSTTILEQDIYRILVRLIPWVPSIIVICGVIPKQTT